MAVLGLLLTTSICTAADTQKLDNLIVYGEGFGFTVKEPSGWIGDTQRAGQFQANVIFYPRGANLESSNTPIIRVLVARKVDEDTATDLAHDMKGYQAQYKDVKFKDIKVAHPTYRPFAKLFYAPGRFFEYVTYLNPGVGKPQLLSVSMNKQQSEATESEFSAYTRVIASLQLL